MLNTCNFSYTASSSTKAGIWTVPYRYSPSIASIKYRLSSICIYKSTHRDARAPHFPADVTVPPLI